MKNFTLLNLLALTLIALASPVLAQGKEDFPDQDLWQGIGNPPFMFSENVIRYRQDVFFKKIVQPYEDAYIEPALRTRDLPNPFNTSLRSEFGFAEATLTLKEVVIK